MGMEHTTDGKETVEEEMETKDYPNDTASHININSEINETEHIPVSVNGNSS